MREISEEDIERVNSDDTKVIDKKMKNRLYLSFISLIVGLMWGISITVIMILNISVFRSHSGITRGWTFFSIIGYLIGIIGLIGILKYRFKSEKTREVLVRERGRMSIPEKKVLEKRKKRRIRMAIGAFLGLILGLFIGALIGRISNKRKK